MAKPYLADMPELWDISDEMHLSDMVDEKGHCLHNDLFATMGPLDETQQCGHCGSFVANWDL